MAAGSVNEARSRWFVRLGPRGDERLRLFCFPYAGGDAVTIYRTWPRILHSSVGVYAVQLPGRSSRIAEPRYADIDSVLRDLRREFLAFVDKPFAFFGHSMGAVIGFELARVLRSLLGREPACLFVSGRRPPHSKCEKESSYDLPDVEFLSELQRMNGTPKEVFENSELLQLIIPLLRADFRLCQTYVFEPGEPLSCPLGAFGGLQDEVSSEVMDEWRIYTRGRFGLRMFSGDHFFIRSEQDDVANEVANFLAQCEIADRSDR